jgi:hypothetical protein
MKFIFYACSIIISVAACNSAEKKPAIVKMDSKEITVGPIVHDSLTSEQMEKVKRIQKTFEEVYPTSLEETVTNFKRDQHPDKEITIWLNMATAYEKYIRKYPRADSAKKKEAFQLILLRSMMPDQEAVQEAKLKMLSHEEITEVLHNYNVEAAPITTRQQ